MGSNEGLIRHAKDQGIFVGYFVFLVLLFYTTNQLHFPQSLGIPGLNVFNIFFVLVLLLSRKYVGYSTPLKRSIYWFWFVCLLGVFISIWTVSTDVMLDLTYFKNIVFYMAGFFLGYRYSRNEKLIKGIVAVILVVAAVAALEAIKEAVAYGIGDYVESHRVSGPFGVDFYSANRAGVFYSMFVPVFLYLALNLSCSKNIKLLLYAGFVLMLVAVFFTYSRQSYFISIISILLVFGKTNKFLLVLLILSLPMYEYWAPESAMQRIDQTQMVDESTGEEMLDVSTESRFHIWSAAWEMFLDNPWGVGLNQFQTQVEPYLGYPKDAHNHYVLTLGELGLLGVVFLLVLIVNIFRISIRAYKTSRDNFKSSLSGAFILMTIAVLLGNLYGSPLYMGEVMFCYWVLLGSVARIYSLQLRKLD